MPEPAGDGAPLLAVVSAHAAYSTNRDPLLCPSARLERKAQHGTQDLRIARLPPNNSANLGIDVGGNKSRNRSVVTSQAEREVVLQLLAMRKPGLQNVLPTG